MHRLQELGITETCKGNWKHFSYLLHLLYLSFVLFPKWLKKIQKWKSPLPPPPWCFPNKLFLSWSHFSNSTYKIPLNAVLAILISTVLAIFIFLLSQDAFRQKSSQQIGEIWSSQSVISYHYEQGGLIIAREYGILLAADVTNKFSVSVHELGFSLVCYI